jgi:hypothetical protein
MSPVAKNVSHDSSMYQSSSGMLCDSKQASLSYRGSKIVALIPMSFEVCLRIQ